MTRRPRKSRRHWIRVMERIRLTQSVFDAMAHHAAADHPAEACGLLLGPDGPKDGVQLVDEAIASPNNAAQAGNDRFEIDPGLHLRTRRDLRGTGRTVVGLYHSHPNGSALASAVDEAGARLEPGLIWLILPMKTQAQTITAGFPAAYLAGKQKMKPLPLDIPDADPTPDAD